MKKNHRSSLLAIGLIVSSSFFFFTAHASIVDPIGGVPGTTITSSAMLLTTVAPATLYTTVLGTQVTVQWSQSIGQAELMVEDQTGQVVVDDMVNTNTTSNYTIDMTGLDSGTYTVILKSNKQQLTTDFTLN